MTEAAAEAEHSRMPSECGHPTERPTGNPPAGHPERTSPTQRRRRDDPPNARTCGHRPCFLRASNMELSRQSKRVDAYTGTPHTLRSLSAVRTEENLATQLVFEDTVGRTPVLELCTHVRPLRFELRTCGLRGRRSTIELGTR